MGVKDPPSRPTSNRSSSDLADDDSLSRSTTAPARVVFAAKGNGCPGL